MTGAAFQEYYLNGPWENALQGNQKVEKEIHWEIRRDTHKMKR